MKIGIDFDDVIIDFTRELMKFHSKKYNKNVQFNDLNEWNWAVYWGVSKEEATRRVDEFHEDRNIEDIPLMDKAVESLRDLGDKYEVYIITGRPVKFKHKVETWLSKNIRKNIPLIHAGEWNKKQGSSKAEICLDLGISILIEDAPGTALECAEKGINIILFDKPWNRNILHEKINRVENWDQAMTILNKYI